MGLTGTNRPSHKQIVAPSASYAFIAPETIRFRQTARRSLNTKDEITGNIVS